MNIVSPHVGFNEIRFIHDANWFLVLINGCTLLLAIWMIFACLSALRANPAQKKD